jgi:hypothetical protein
MAATPRDSKGDEMTKKPATKKASAAKVATKRSAKTKAATKTRASRKTSARRTTSRPTLATIAAQLDALSEQVAELTRLVRERAGEGIVMSFGGGDHSAQAQRTNGAHTADVEAFESELLALVADLDRRGRHSGMVPIPELRTEFLDRGWTREVFDDRLLQAERDFIVDLKVANDPARLANPQLAIEQPGRGYLQYVVVR